MNTPLCRHCGSRLRPEYETDWATYRAAVLDGADPADPELMRRHQRPNGRFGYRGEGKFCKMSCGYLWAVRYAA